MAVKTISAPISRGRKKKTEGGLLYAKITLLFSIVLLGLIVGLYLKSAAEVIGSQQDIGQKTNVGAAPSLIRGGDSPKKHVDAVVEKKDDIVTMSTSQGDLRIKFRPDLSLPSVNYIKALLNDPGPCNNCKFYRAEKPGILQGILKKSNVKANTILGDCPEEVKSLTHKCPEHDPNCKCHGPVMERGMIGWAGGGAGPDFFIDTYVRKAEWWNTDHTVWGELADKESLAIAISFYELPATTSRMTMLDKPVHIDIH
jgi:cyclophilin family peptidyl-prolyl cis-trans isomerase